MNAQGERKAEYEELRPRIGVPLAARRSVLGWVREERREGEKQYEVGGNPVLIFRESGSQPVHAPCLIQQSRFPDTDLPSYILLYIIITYRV